MYARIVQKKPGKDSDIARKRKQKDMDKDRAGQSFLPGRFKTENSGGMGHGIRGNRVWEDYSDSPSTAGPPIQRKLIYEGKELKKREAGSFIGDFHSNTNALQILSDDNRQVTTLVNKWWDYRQMERTTREEDAEAEVFDNDTQISRAFIESLIDEELYYYIGVRKDIIDTLVDMYYNMNRLSSLPNKGTEAVRKQVIGDAIRRLYRLSKSDACSEHLIDMTAQRLNDYGAEISDGASSEHYQPPKEYVMVKSSPGEGTNNKKVSGKRSDTFWLTEGEYIYRSMQTNDLQKLLNVSKPIPGNAYQIDLSKTQRELEGALSGHAGNLTQAAEYKGVMVRFKMKSDFMTAVLGAMNDNQGTSESGKVGLKYEDEDLLRGSQRKSFSFNLNNAEASKTFLNYVDSFQVFNLGKTDR